MSGAAEMTERVSCYGRAKIEKMEGKKEAHKKVNRKEGEREERGHVRAGRMQGLMKRRID